jgi:lipoprotein-anchoring transpeptidase ErfK/SrfK
MRMSQSRYAVVFLLIVASTFVLSFRQGGAAKPGDVAQAPATVVATTLVATPEAANSPTSAAQPPLPAAAATLAVTPTLAVTATAPLTGTAPVATAVVTATIAVTATASVTPAALTFDPRPDLPRYAYIDQGVQHMYVLEQGAVVRDIPCSTGLPFSNTYTPAWTGVVGEYWGTFFAYEVYADEAWFLFKSDGSILIHSLPYTATVAEGPKLYQDADLLGVRPASHGCIRISPEDALWFTAWDPEGVPITVTDPYRDKWK